MRRQAKIDAVAIDGPAASGKSSVGASVARRLGFAFLDTGLMYRAATLAAMERGVDASDAPALGEMAERLRMALDADRLIVDGADVSDRLHSASVDRNVSEVSAHPEVRRALVRRQRNFGEGGAVVMAGRDIGTAVLPDARLKVYLDASSETRARRRFAERAASGATDADFERELRETVRRDKLDSERADSPLKPAADAVVINTDDLTAEEVADAVTKLAKYRLTG